MNGSSGSLDLLLDTHVLVWAVASSPRMSERASEALFDVENRLFISAATAWEYADLHTRGRLPAAIDLSVALEALVAAVLDLPAGLWRLAATLPDIHRDPIDRMLIAHALQADMTLVTADATVRAYPVRTLW